MHNPKTSVVPEAGPNTPASENSFAELLSEFEQQHANGRGEALQGTVVSITADSVFVDIGRKMEGVLPLEHFRDKNGELGLHLGDRLLVTVTGRDSEGSYTLSTLKVERPRDWSGFERAFEEKRIIGGTVTELVKGGFRVDVGVPAFLPASRSGVREQADMESLIGQQIECRIIKVDVADEDIVLDRRSVLEEQEAANRDQAFSDLREGAVVRGTVRSLTDFGAFVDIGGVDGLLHVSDMGWSRIAKPSDVVSVSDSVEVKILKVNADKRRVSLGMKQLAPDPWTLAADRFHIGDRVQGKISRLTDFGAFIELMPGVDGLIHVSELSWSKKVRSPGDVLKPGELVEAIVLGIHVGERRISLGLKQALGDPWEDAQNKYTPGTVVEGPVTTLMNFGAFIDLGNGIEGMIHIGDISPDKRLNHPREMLSQGRVVRAVVLELDRERRRVKLGMKQLEPTSIDHYIEEHKVGETVTGRLVDVANGTGKAELGEGILVKCRIPAEAAAAPAAREETAKTDLSSLTAMLSAKWKQGGAGPSQPSREQARAGQVRSFRITNLDPAQKRIEVELAE
ncbi:MAG: 30S ribosomal protein S1 [Bryobacteraceae bacterium]